MEMEFRAAQEGVTPTQPPRARPAPARWKSPPHGSFKINTDAAIFEESRSIALGAVLRNSEGKMLWAMSHCLPGLKSPIVAEALAVREAVKAVSRMRLEGVIVESDNLEVIRALANKSEGWRTEMQGIIVDCLEYGRGLPQWMVCHVRRDGNKVAHEVAKLSSSFDGEMIWYHDFPSSLVSVASMDLTRV